VRQSLDHLQFVAVAFAIRNVSTVDRCECIRCFVAYGPPSWSNCVVVLKASKFGAG
jgi:hypothetical protein